MQKFCQSMVGPCNSGGFKSVSSHHFFKHASFNSPDPQAFKQYLNTAPREQLFTLMSQISPHTLSGHFRFAQPTNTAVDSSVSGQSEKCRTNSSSEKYTQYHCRPSTLWCIVVLQHNAAALSSVHD